MLLFAGRLGRHLPGGTKDVFYLRDPPSSLGHDDLSHEEELVWRFCLPVCFLYTPMLFLSASCFLFPFLCLPRYSRSLYPRPADSRERLSLYQVNAKYTICLRSTMLVVLA